MPMNTKDKSKIMDEKVLPRTIMRIAHEIVEKNKNVEDLCLIGVRKRGAPIAQRLAACIKEIAQVNVPVGVLDITMYRDDLNRIGLEQLIAHKTEIDFDINDKNLIIVDDVLYAGRTARSALDALIDFGRPRRIQLAVLVDRGHRELPIRADYVGKNIPTAGKQTVQVRVKEIDGVDEVVVLEEQVA